MAITLKEETILDEWSTMVDRGASHADEVLQEIERRLQASEIPGDCSWSVEEVKSSGWFSKVKREFLLVRLEQFSDYRMYIAVRAYGAHLDVSRFLTVEPGFFKRNLSAQLGGADDSLSTPKNILVQQDLRAWVTVVHHCVVDAVGATMEKLGQDKMTIQRGSKGFLNVW